MEQESSQIICANHHQKIVLICIEKQCLLNRFICTKCIQENTFHLNQHKDIIDYNEFIDGLQWNFNEDYFRHQIEEILINKDEIMDKFDNYANMQCEKEETICRNLQIFYEKKCDELQRKIKFPVLLQKNHVHSIFQMLEQQIQLDNQLIAVEQFENIWRAYELQPPSEKNQFLLKQFQLKYNIRSQIEQIKELCDQRQEYFKQTIQELSKETIIPQPSVIQIDMIWNTGLDKLIKKIENMFRPVPQIIKKFEININDIQKLYILSDLVVDNHVQLNIDLSKRIITHDTIQLISSKLQTFEKPLNLHFNLSHIEIQETSLILFSQMFQDLNDLRELHIILNEVEIQNFYPLLQGLSEIQNIRVLFLNLEQTNVNDINIEKVAIILTNLYNLQKLTLKLGYNNITKLGAQKIAKSLESIQDLKILELSFSGYSRQHNQLENLGIQIICKSLITVIITYNNLFNIQNMYQQLLQINFTNSRFLNHQYFFKMRNLTIINTQTFISFKIIISQKIYKF